MLTAPNRFADSEGNKYAQRMCLRHRGIEGRRARQLGADTAKAGQGELRCMLRAARAACTAHLPPPSY